MPGLWFTLVSILASIFHAAAQQRGGGRGARVVPRGRGTVANQNKASICKCVNFIIYCRRQGEGEREREENGGGGGVAALPVHHLN